MAGIAVGIGSLVVSLLTPANLQAIVQLFQKAHPIPADATPAVKADINALKEFIKETHHSGPPHACLRLFKERCIPGTVHWSTVLRLYLAAYCQPVAKELWQFAIMMAGGGLCGSTETEMTTQRFVSQTPIEIDPIIDLILDEAAAAAVG